MIRKIWLTFFLLPVIIYFIALFGFSYFAYEIVFSKKYFLTIMYFTLLVVTINYIYYHCAYKNPGTKLLFLSMIICGICVIQNLIDFIPICLISDPLYNKALIWIKLVFVLLLIFPIFWGYLCYKMRQNNFEIRVREVEVCEAFMEIAQNIRESEDPKAVYIKAARKYPQTAWYFKRVLKETTC